MIKENLLTADRKDKRETSGTPRWLRESGDADADGQSRLIWFFIALSQCVTRRLAALMSSKRPRRTSTSSSRKWKSHETPSQRKTGACECLCPRTMRLMQFCCHTFSTLLLRKPALKSWKTSYPRIVAPAVLQEDIQGTGDTRQKEKHQTPSSREELRNASKSLNSAGLLMTGPK